MRYLALLFLLALFFAGHTPPPVPDYTQEKYWIALPWRHDIGDTIPPGCAIKENQAAAVADVFYIHPTVYLSGNAWNADLSGDKLNEKCDACVKFQGTAFNACGRVFAPRYRQAVLRSFSTKSPEGEKALDLAYADVKQAFEYYLANWNKGRPIIIAGHSQGARHVQRLLKEFFDGKPLGKQLVAAYAIGYSIPKDEYKTIPVGDSATQTGCFIAWNTVAWGLEPDGNYLRYKGCTCVNPLTWKTSDETAPATLHLGAERFSYKKIDPEFCSTKVHDGLLWIKLQRPGEVGYYYHFGNNFHMSDINLFYMNIRKNAVERVAAFGRKQ